MKTKQSGKSQRQERGTVIVLVSLSMVVLFGFAALSIDVAHVHQQQRDMQSAADAAALAGVSFLTNGDPLAQGTLTAQAIALTNGILAAEITSNTVGIWDTNAIPPFTAATEPCSNCNAVLVSASRSVPLLFGKVVGFGNMTPTARSVAALTYPSSVYGISPFLLRTIYATNAFNVPFTVSKNEYQNQGPGDKGPLDLTGVTPSGASWDEQMINGCGCTVSLGQDLTEDTGNGNPKPSDLWNDVLHQTIVMPIVSQVGVHNAEVVGFSTVYVQNVGGTPGNWTVTLVILNEAVTGGSGTGGTGSGAPLNVARVLVQ